MRSAASTLLKLPYCNARMRQAANTIVLLTLWQTKTGSSNNLTNFLKQSRHTQISNLNEALPQCPKNTDRKLHTWAAKPLMQWGKPTPGHARKHKEQAEKADSGENLQAY